MELLERFAVGDLDAFETLFREFQGAVYAWIVRIVRDPAAAEDLTVDTFWRIYRARARFDPGREFLPWARRIATNLALDHLNGARRAAALAQAAAVESGGDTVPVDGRVGKAIMLALRQLPAKLQAVATLALIEERPYAEIAGALGISVPAVKSREFRAIRLLRKKLKRWGVEP